MRKRMAYEQDKIASKSGDFAERVLLQHQTLKLETSLKKKYMKNKLLILNIISYILLYHIVYELINYFFVEKGHVGATPIGHIIDNFNHLKYRMSDFMIIFINFFIHMLVSGILLYCIYKWYNKMSFFILFLLLLLFFIIISILLLMLLLFLAYITNGMLFLVFITLYFPMPIMFILILPLFKLNKMLLGYKD